MKKGIIISAALFLLCSCSQNAFEEMLFRTTDDPFDDVPLADSLSLEHTVFLSWKIDEGCDRYLLMRSCDQPVLNFECVYEGTETRWTDRDIPDGRRYVYRLDKTRGRKRFEGKDYAYGYSSDCRKDAWEDNDTEERAVRLDHDLICSLPCVRYLTDSREYLDCDWFYIEIPPRRNADIVVSQSNLEDATEGADTDIMVQPVGKGGEPVKQKKAVRISNTSYETGKFLFKVYPDATQLFDATGIRVIGYTVSLKQIYDYTF